MTVLGDRHFLSPYVQVRITVARFTQPRPQNAASASRLGLYAHGKLPHCIHIIEALTVDSVLHTSAARCTADFPHVPFPSAFDKVARRHRGRD